VTKPFVRPGATVIDVGINRLDTKAAVEKMFPGDAARMATFEKRGALIVGDVHPDVAEVAGALTPVPGGVGPLTIALLLRNTLRVAQARTGLMESSQAG
jgi:methylenetetrahydrofolate dehydrogenase (NADP+)/methenyltetrahydrofolate cyclohydrolase